MSEYDILSIGPSSPPSRPQTELYEIVKQRYPDAELDYHVYTLEGRDRWIDISIPPLMVAIEYMGRFWHSGLTAGQRDKVRKREIEDVGWRYIEVNKMNCLRFIGHMEAYVEGWLKLKKG